MTRFAIENTSMEVYWTDVDARLVDANPAACRALGYRREALLKLDVTDIAPAFPPGQWASVVDQLRRQGHLTLETLHQRRDGSRYPVEIQITLLRAGDEELICGFAHDISGRKSAQRALSEAGERYRSVIDTARDGFWITDYEARLLEVNDAYCRMSGFSREELLAKRIPELDAEESPDVTARRIETTVADGNALFETRHRRKDGTSWPVEVAVSHSPIEGGRFFVFLRDIHERKLAEHLTELRQQLSEIVYQGDMDQLMRAALDAAEVITESRIGFFHFVERDQANLSLQVWSTRTLREMCFAEGEGLHYPVSEAGVWVDCIHRREPVIHNDYPSLPHKKGLPEGHPLLQRELTVPVFRDDLIVAVMGVGDKAVDYDAKDVEIVSRVADTAYDYVERKRAEQHIEYMAYYDALTGLPNRSLLSDRLNQAMAMHRRNGRLLAVCYLDLDGFKPVNDSYGHDVGDALLVELAERLREMLREGDTLARLSGDEFLILLAELPGDREGEAIVRRILEIIGRPFSLTGHTIRISGSIGVTLFPTDDVSADTLLRHADQAMYQAKNTGPGAFRLYDPVQDHKLRQHHDTLAEIRRALQEQEFTLHYQPRIELDGGRPVGAEALIRWQHPDRGLLMPGTFLPEVEGEPEEIALGEWVVRTALEQLAAWRAQGIELPVSVNISPNHLQTDGFVDFLARTLADYPPDTASRLELEVLETAAIGDTARVAAVMRDCAGLGVSFSLDDFGTGYSSLTYFHRLPIDVLKIDRNFVSHMIEEVSDLDIVEGVLRLADALRRPVVAEGVENVEIGYLLFNLGCRYAQGYGIARPMAPDDLPHWLQTWSRNNVWETLSTDDTGNKGDFDLRVAIFSHRLWMERIRRHLTDKTPGRAPSTDAHGCQFNHWYQGLGRARYGDRPLYAFLPPKHARIHELAERLVGQTGDDPAGIEEGLAEMDRLSAELIDMLVRLQGR